MNPPAQSSRLISLDAFRGATIAGMLLVNNPGSWNDLYAPLAHAPWHGWTPTDMIFPFFLWIVGVAMTLSFARRVADGADRGALFRHVAVRAAVIFGLGLFLAAFPFGLLPAHNFSLERLRIPGVLQRIGVCYLVAGAIFLRTGWRGQLAWAVGLLAGYWALLMLVPVPGHGAGGLEPGNNLAGWIDARVLAGHTWSGAPAPGFDPEGILSTLPAIATTLLGVLAGQVIRTWSGAALTGRLLGWGAAVLVLGWLMGLILPINKSLLTSSYAVFMAGWAMVLLAACHWLIDVRGWKRWATPLVIYGSNALAMFVLAGLVGKLLFLIKWTGEDGKAVTLKTWIYQGFYVPLASPVNASLLFALTFVLVFFIIAWALWRKKWFLKI
jgi:predicted acyltransferase